MMSIKLPLIIRIGDGAMHERTEGARTGRGPLSRPVPSTQCPTPCLMSRSSQTRRVTQLLRSRVNLLS
jgi:hypothetical protein